MNAQSTGLEAATIEQQCKLLHLPTVAGQCAQLAEQAARERRTHLGFLEALLQAELEHPRDLANALALPSQDPNLHRFLRH